MRAIVFTTSSYFSELILGDVLEDSRVDVVKAFVLPSQGSSGGVTAAVRTVAKKSGWRFVNYKAVMSVAAAVRAIAHRTGLRAESVTPEGLFKVYRIPVEHVTDCNAEAVVDEVKSAEVDLVISVNVYQRMREGLLSAPRVAAVNCHFGMLPEYQGMSPVIWAMSRGEGQIGLSIHRMVLEFDQGQLLRQVGLQVEKGESVFSVTRRGCIEASELLLQACLQLGRDPQSGVPQEGAGSYYSLPTREAISSLYARGHRLWRYSDLRFVWS